MGNNTIISTIIAAGGQGIRLGANINKQYVILKGRPVLYYSIYIFSRIPLVKEIIIVVSPGEEQLCWQTVIKPYFSSSQINIKIVDGGRERQDSVWHGLKAISPETDIVCIHDGARPVVTETLVMRVINKALEHGAAIAAVPVTETIKEVNERYVICRTPPRENIWVAQTPQCFRRNIIAGAYRSALEKGVRVTDDASLVERLDVSVHVVKGSYSNIKLTTPEDMRRIELILDGGPQKND